MEEWLKKAGPEADIVISSRVRIARNVEGIPFPHNITDDKAQEIVDKVYHGMIEGNSSLRDKFQLISMKGISEIERLNYVEKHLISPDLTKNVTIGNMLLNSEETISIMIHEEDHIRIQCLLPGLQLENAWNTADKIDDLLEEKIDYAFDEELGYLTTCPTNLGTGMRASVMMHLPALGLTRYIQGVLRAAGQIGLDVRGIYGEGTEFLGNLYQISNQVTLGVTEKEIVGNLHDVTLQIIEKERIARQSLLTTKKIELEDKVFRSFGILKNARKITAHEAMQLISDVKLGVDLRLIQEVQLEKLNGLITMIQPGYLQKHFNRILGVDERDVKRAELIREVL
ncbi:protein arginine kinase [Clostridium formicaceticum]|uniref:Protein-arginine kinase n=1 Tax=Clostridium formicaceticum TaxID=1497 RepID=A0AAC9WIA6_9CLOT|nr:protein arginine kinase [Clostridium formicaceticum]AOY75139.1 protein arginine kinase [Clostridium formicaceticum]ARE89564.1 Putative ATP:guanido phosphotransferase [Clostridium formicaceticum]